MSGPNPIPVTIPNILTIDAPKFSPDLDPPLRPNIGLIFAAIILNKTSEGKWRAQSPIGLIELPPNLSLQKGQEIHFRVVATEPSIKLALILPDLAKIPLSPPINSNVADLFDGNWNQALFTPTTNKGQPAQQSSILFLSIDGAAIKGAQTDPSPSLLKEEGIVTPSLIPGKVRIEGAWGNLELEGHLPIGSIVTFLIKPNAPTPPSVTSPSPLDHILKTWQDWGGGSPEASKSTLFPFFPKAGSQFAALAERLGALLTAPPFSLPPSLSGVIYNPSAISILSLLRAFQDSKNDNSIDDKQKSSTQNDLTKLPARQLMEFLTSLIESKDNSPSNAEMFQKLTKNPETHLPMERLAQLAQPANDQNWRFFFLPMASPQGTHLWSWADRKMPKTGNHKRPYHFIVSFFFSSLGQMQIEGLMAEKKFDLIIRSERKLENEIEQDLHQIYARILSETGYKGAMNFNPGLPFPMDPQSAALSEDRFPLWI